MASHARFMADGKVAGGWIAKGEKEKEEKEGREKIKGDGYIK